jgi:hypothetical protein
MKADLTLQKVWFYV